jgi:DNA replication licensing factor MCM2
VYGNVTVAPLVSISEPSSLPANSEPEVYLHLALSKAILAYFLTDSPAAWATLTIFDAQSWSTARPTNASTLKFMSILPTLSSSRRDLRSFNLNLVRVGTGRSGIFWLLKIKFDGSRKCSAVFKLFWDLFT